MSKNCRKSNQYTPFRPRNCLVRPPIQQPLLTNVAIGALAGPSDIEGRAEILFVVTNSTNITAENVIVTVPIPVSVLVDSLITAKGTVSQVGTDIIWNIGTLNPAETVQLTIVRGIAFFITFWTGTVVTSTPEISTIDNQATALSPFSID